MSYKMERLGRLIIIDWLLQKEYWENDRIKLGPKERFLNFISNNPDLLIRVPQKYLASYLNIKPETFSRYKTFASTPVEHPKKYSKTDTSLIQLSNLPLKKNNIKYIEKIHQYFNGFVPLTDEEFKQLLPYFEIREFAKKQQVVKFGEVDNYFNIILKGLVRKYTIVGKKDVTLQLSIEGHMIHSEISFNTQTPSDTIVEAIEPTIFLSMSYDNLQEVYRKFPKIEKLGRLIITYMFIKKDFRDFSQLKKTTRQRFMDYMKSHADMLQRVPQKYIASYLNIKPETFSRLKHLMKQKSDRTA